MRRGDDRPHLVALDPDTPPPAPAPSETEREPRPWLPWVAGAVLVAALVAGAGWWGSAQESARLAGALAATQDALASTQHALTVANDRLEAHDQHLAVIRDRVDSLVRDLVSLDTLVERDPAPAERAPAAPGPGAEAAPGE